MKFLGKNLIKKNPIFDMLKVTEYWQDKSKT